MSRWADIVFKYSTETPSQILRKFSLLMTGYIGIIDKSIRKSFPHELIQLLSLFTKTEDIEQKFMQQFRVKLEPSTSVIGREISRTMSIPFEKYGYPSSFYLAANLCTEYYWVDKYGGNCSGIITISASHEFGGYLNIRHSEENEDLEVIEDPTSNFPEPHYSFFICIIERDGSFRIMENSFTFLCHIEPVPFQTLPSHNNGRMEYLWNVDRQILSNCCNSGDCLKSRVLQIYDDNRYPHCVWMEIMRNEIWLYLKLEEDSVVQRSLRYTYWIDIEFDEMRTKWCGSIQDEDIFSEEYGFEQSFRIYPYRWDGGHLHSAQYYNGWMKRFIPTINCIKLLFKQE